jgi:hypothetical protein
MNKQKWSANLERGLNAGEVRDVAVKPVKEVLRAFSKKMKG